MIHAAIMGSIERFMSTLIEHLAGQFPTWLNPVQVAVIPVRDEHIYETKKIIETLSLKDIRVEHIDYNESLGKRIHAAKKMNSPYVIVLGDKEKESGLLTIEKRDGSKTQMTLTDFTTHIQEEIKNRS